MGSIGHRPAVGVHLEHGEADGALLVLVVRRGRGVGVAQRVALDDGARGAAGGGAALGGGGVGGLGRAHHRHRVHDVRRRHRAAPPLRTER